MGGAHFIHWRVHLPGNFNCLCFILSVSDVPIIKVINRRPGSVPAGTTYNIMREQNSYTKSAFSAVTAFFLCRPVHYPARWLAAVIRKKMSLTDRRPGWRWLAIIPAPGGSSRLASVAAAKRPAVLLAGWRPGSPAALATGTGTRHTEKVYFIQLLDGLRARYMHFFTIIAICLLLYTIISIFTNWPYMGAVTPEKYGKSY